MGTDGNLGEFPKIFSGVYFTRKRKITISKSEYGAWQWVCTMCHPTCRGSNKRFAQTVSRASAHLRHRYFHHKFVIESKGSTITVSPVVVYKPTRQHQKES